jgi:hypothetical protein
MTEHREKALVFCFFVLMSILFVSFDTAFCASIGKSDVVSLYTEAEQMFRQANEIAVNNPEKANELYRRSVMRFERIVKDGDIENGKIYYNIGNAYFRLNDLGMAILNYKKAELYIPDDQNLKHNLKYARSKRTDNIAEKQKTKILKILFFWHYDLSSRIRLMIFMSMFAGLWLFACVRLFTESVILKRLIVFSAIGSALMAGSIIVEELSLKRSRPGVIISSAVVPRKGNGETYQPSFKEPLHSGTEFTLIEKREDWFFIELRDSRKCWIMKKDAGLINLL